MKVRPIREDLQEYITAHNLERKWNKIISFLESNLRHPSLQTELLEPRWRGIYSFRIDKEYRGLFFIASGTIEVFKITKHYKK